MGYMTRYSLTWDKVESAPARCECCGAIKTGEFEDAIQKAIDAKTLYKGECSISDMLTDETKWYEHEKDMIALSMQFPNAVFTLSGEGEDSGDVWVKYFKHGKMQYEKAEIKLPAFDSKKLK